MSATFSRSLASIAIASAIVVCRSVVGAEIPWSTDVEDSLRQAAASGQPVLMEFTADWCVYCKKMEKNTFTNPDVAQRISDSFVAVKVDADANKELVKELGIKALPAILIVAPDLNVIERISGFQTPEALIPKLDAVTAARKQRPTSAQVSNSRPAKQPSKAGQPLRNTSAQQPGFDETSKAPPRAARRELEFEPIAQDEAPQAGHRPGAKKGREQINEQPNSESDPAVSATAKPDPESFFKTISQKNAGRNTPPEHAAPAFGGLCLVSAVDDRELIKGSTRNQIQYRGQTVYFSSAENKERFLAAPASYWPMLDGKCAMSLINNDESVEGSLEFAAVFRKRVWLFESKEAMQEFLTDPADIAEEALERNSTAGR